MRNSATKECEKQGSELALLELQDWGTSGGCAAVTGRSLDPRLSVGLCALELHRLHTGLSPWPRSLPTIKKKKNLILQMVSGTLQVPFAVLTPYFIIGPYNTPCSEFLINDGKLPQQFK